MVRIILAILLMASTTGAQVEYDQRIKEKQWYRPDTLKDAYTFRNKDKQAMVKIGNRTRGQAEPSVTFTRWENINTENAAYFKIWLDSTMGANIRVNEDSSFTINNKHRLYMKSDTEFEWEMILYERPKISSWTFSMETTNVNSFHQPELTQEEKDAGANRPENKINSYAFYHSSKVNNRRIINGNDTTFENYMAGKMGHLDRWWAKDATGDKIWLNQIMVDGNLTVDGPPQWFEIAVLPITIGPTFGHTGVGASEINWAQDEAYGHILAAQQYTASTGDTITQYSIHGRRSGGSGGCDMVAYLFVSGAPSSRLTTPATITFPGGGSAWQNSGAVTHGLSDGVTYVVCTGNKTGGSDPYFSYDNVSNSISVQFSTTLGASWSDDFTYLYKVSMYATYTTVAVPTAAQFISIGGQ